VVASGYLWVKEAQPYLDIDLGLSINVSICAQICQDSKVCD